MTNTTFCACCNNLRETGTVYFFADSIEVCDDCVNAHINEIDELHGCGIFDVPTSVEAMIDENEACRAHYAASR